LLSLKRIRSIRLTLQGLVTVALLIWGSYAILLVQTSPSDERSIITAALTGESNLVETGITGSGTVIQSGTRVQYILTFETNVASNVGPSPTQLNGGGGYAFGPVLWSPSNSASSSYRVEYAVFTYSFNWVPGPQGCCPQWFSGPQGNISASTGIGSYGGLEGYAPSGPGWGTSILQVDAAGNYTLHFSNTGTIGNATGRVAMGSSSVSFSRSRPYLLAGETTLGLAAAFVVGTILVSSRRVKPAS
jgi:hypothetical protein